MHDHNYFAGLIWQIADLLRGPYRPPQYERVMLPMTVLRRFDCVLAPTKAKVLAERKKRKGGRIVQVYGRQLDGETSKVFDNADFGYTRVTVERPLRLRYQMTRADKARFLDECSELSEDVEAIEKELGCEPLRDWNAVWSCIEEVLDSRESWWRASERKLFRSVFTQKDPEAEPVVRGGRDGGYEPDADLRDFENVPAQGRRRRVLRAGGASPCTRRVHGPQQGQGRLRDQLQPPLLQVHAAAPAGGDRRGTEAGGGRDHAVAE